jgi:hypothetical protein
VSTLNQTQLITRVRRSAFLANSDVNFTDAVILEDLNDVQTQLYARAVVEADQGVWQLTDYTPLVANQRSYRLPARAVMGTTMRSQVSATGSVDWWAVEDLSEADALRYEYGSTGSSPIDAPTRKITRGENYWLLPPVATSGAYVMRTHYMVRPSRICAAQTAPLTAGVITAINSVTRALTVTAAIQSIAEDGTNGGNILTGTITIDIIRVGGWHKVQWTGSATFSASGLTITLAADASGLSEANDLSDIAVGDVVRVADQTDWPALPADFHRSLADATAAKILTARGMADRANELSQSSVVPDLQRFGDLLRPRDGSSAFVFVAPEFC